ALRRELERARVPRQLDLRPRLELVQLHFRLGEVLLRHLLRLALHRIRFLRHALLPFDVQRWHRNPQPRQCTSPGEAAMRLALVSVLFAAASAFAQSGPLAPDAAAKLAQGTFREYL